MMKANSVSYDHVLLKPSEQIGLHHWNSWEMSYIISGEGRRVLGDTEESFRAGEVVLVVPEMPHQWVFDPDKTDRDGNIENITISFSPDLLRRLSGVVPEFCQLAEWYEHLDTSVKFKPAECEKIAAVLRRMEQESAAERVTSLLQMLIAIHRNRNFTVARPFCRAVFRGGENKEDRSLHKLQLQPRLQHRPACQTRRHEPQFAMHDVQASHRRDHNRTSA